MCEYFFARYGLEILEKGREISVIKMLVKSDAAGLPKAETFGRRKENPLPGSGTHIPYSYLYYLLHSGPIKSGFPKVTPSKYGFQDMHKSAGAAGTVQTKYRVSATRHLKEQAGFLVSRSYPEREA